MKNNSPKLVCISYPKFNKYNKKQLEAQAKFDMMILNIKQKRKESIKQSKEDKAKYKASLAAFKTNYVRTYKVGNVRNPVKGTGCHKKTRIKREKEMLLLTTQKLAA